MFNKWCLRAIIVFTYSCILACLCLTGWGFTVGETFGLKLLSAVFFIIFAARLSVVALAVWRDWNYWR